jgi:beta-glucosidase
MLLFLGDSITQYWDGGIFHRDFAQYNPVNFAVGGNTTHDLINRIEAGLLNGQNPKLIVLLIGVCNLPMAGETDTEKIAGDIKQILQTLLTMFPLAKILLRGLLPYGKYKEEHTRIHNEKINAIISGFANTQNILYIDNSREFLDADGAIMNNLLYDNLHLTVEGYEVLSRCLTPTIKALME